MSHKNQKIITFCSIAQKHQILCIRFHLGCIIPSFSHDPALTTLSCCFQVSVLTTLERRFNLQSADVGVIASSFEIGNLALILFVSYFGARAHRPRLIGCGGIVMAFGAFLSALPEFLISQYEIGKDGRTDVGREICSNSTSIEAQQEDILCTKKANTNMMYLLLIGAQVLLGIGATPVQPLGVSYIDDHVKKKDSSLYIGKLYYKVFHQLYWMEGLKGGRRLSPWILQVNATSLASRGS